MRTSIRRRLKLNVVYRIFILLVRFTLVVLFRLAVPAFVLFRLAILASFNICRWLTIVVVVSYRSRLCDYSAESESTVLSQSDMVESTRRVS